MTATQATSTGMTKDERFVILASSLGTVFEWYDFYLFGSLAGIIGAQFFNIVDPATNAPMFVIRCRLAVSGFAVTMPMEARCSSQRGIARVCFDSPRISSLSRVMDDLKSWS